jgi:hypothetical protein
MFRAPLKPNARGQAQTGRRLPLSASLYYRDAELPEVGLHQCPSEKKGQTAPGRARHVPSLVPCTCRAPRNRGPLRRQRWNSPQRQTPESLGDAGNTGKGRLSGAGVAGGLRHYPLAERGPAVAAPNRYRIGSPRRCVRCPVPKTILMSRGAPLPSPVTTSRTTPSWAGSPTTTACSTTNVAAKFGVDQR